MLNWSWPMCSFFGVHQLCWVRWKCLWESNETLGHSKAEGEVAGGEGGEDINVKQRKGDGSSRERSALDDTRSLVLNVSGQVGCFLSLNRLRPSLFLSFLIVSPFLLFIQQLPHTVHGEVIEARTINILCSCVSVWRFTTKEDCDR